jgi:hypothetical protein
MGRCRPTLLGVVDFRFTQYAGFASTLSSAIQLERPLRIADVKTNLRADEFESKAVKKGVEHDMDDGRIGVTFSAGLIPSSTHAVGSSTCYACSGCDSSAKGISSSSSAIILRRRPL